MGSYCDCLCHTISYAACDVPGGCGSTGCGQTRTGSCVTCPVIRPDSKARDPHNPPVCDGDRTLINRWLGEIAGLVADLTNDEPAIVDDRRHERFATVYFEGGIRHVFSKGLFPSDPVSVLGGVAPINSRSKQPDVSGSRERAVPININRLDLIAPARVQNPTRDASGNDHQQHLVPQVRLSSEFRPVTASFDGKEITQQVRDREYVRDRDGKLVMIPAAEEAGGLSVATALDEWVRDIRHRMFADQHLPAATVDQMVMWLRVRLDDICDGYPQVADFALALKQLRGALRSATGQSEPPPQPCDGVTCARCDQRALFHKPTDTYRAECGNCGTLYTDDEYTAIVEEQAAAVRR
ncbi:hypothetical protein [Paractinoplanes toevensis]|uniref:Uncharacterized protein n=1 Tax=Paractinoplanes toevensis TaxID=571911 RepID=A0A919W1W7_9ACTN|nr:hypothetical protein [Actinoplanes toevensis]GIM88880.1 hypothetical protein Ato02nite_006730 [Actinoplanes toevensis]